MKITTDSSGHSLIELALIVPLLCVVAFGIIDFSRALYDAEVMTNLVGEGSSMASRGTSPALTASTVANDAGNDLSLSTLGCVIVTQVTKESSLQVTAQNQVGACGVGFISKVGCLQGHAGCGNTNNNNPATLPATAVDLLNSESTGYSLYVTEMFYSYSTITPISLASILPSQLYRAAYY
jgi:Flp pilus assembly protein TadG